MSHAVNDQLLKTSANTAAADTCGTAIVPLRGGGIERAFRGIFVISAPLTESPADPKCTFSGF